jgi:hypothetical protein
MGSFDGGSHLSLFLLLNSLGDVFEEEDENEEEAD